MALAYPETGRYFHPAPGRPAALLFAGLLLFSPLLRAEATSLISYPLDGDWQFRQVGQETWHPARVPGCVHLDLMAAGLIPDPFYRDNELRVQWVEKESWEYRREFKVTALVSGKVHVELVAQGLDTFALIFLNGEKVGETDNMFRTWRLDIKPFLRPGQNEIVIRFDSPARRARGDRRSRSVPAHAGLARGRCSETVAAKTRVPVCAAAPVPRPAARHWTAGRALGRR